MVSLSNHPLGTNGLCGQHWVREVRGRKCLFNDELNEGHSLTLIHQFQSPAGAPLQQQQRLPVRDLPSPSQDLLDSSFRLRKALLHEFHAPCLAMPTPYTFPRPLSTIICNWTISYFPLPRRPPFSISGYYLIEQFWLYGSSPRVRGTRYEEF